MADNPLTSTEIYKLHKMIRLPQQTSLTVIFRLISLYGSSIDPYSISTAITTFDGILAALTDDQCTGLRSLISTWDTENLDVSDIEVDSDNGTSGGSLYSAHKRKANIRDTISQITGFMIPTGGFVNEVKAATPRGGPRLVC